MTIWARWLSGWLGARARMRGCEIGKGCMLGPGVRLRPGYAEKRGRIVLGDRCALCDGAVLEAWGGAIRLQPSVFVGPYAVIYGHGGVEIGDHTLISMHARILSSEHEIPPPGLDIRSRPDLRKPTRIGRDVWLGAGVTVLGGSEIGDGCVVGAGAVVKGLLPPGAVAVGVPARVVRSRT